MPDSFPICRLCNSAPADETGSHLLTAWLIASAYDDQGRTRDYEIIYDMSEEIIRFPYFGRSVSSEKIEENLGRELKEKEIEAQKNIYVEDHIFCRKCEKRLKTIEDEFLKKIHRVLDSECLENLKAKKENKIENSENLIIRVFIYSLIWRASVSNSIDFKLTQNLENKLGRILNNTLDLNLNKTLENLSIQKSLITSLPIILIKLEKAEHSTESSVILHRKFIRPFSFIINDYIILLYEKEQHIRSVEQDFFGITRMFDKDSLLNFNETNFKIGFFELDKVKLITKKITAVQVETDYENMRKFYREAFKVKFGNYPEENLFIKFYKALAINEKKIGVKRTRESILEAMNKSLK